MKRDVIRRDSCNPRTDYGTNERNQRIESGYLDRSAYSEIKIVREGWDFWGCFNFWHIFMHS